jgi:hypothetical protein
MPEQFTPDQIGWFTKSGTAQLAQMQKNTPYGITGHTKMMIACHTQFEDIEVLLKCMHDSLSGEMQQAVAKIAERHERYRKLRDHGENPGG